MRSELAELAAGLLDHLEAQRLLGANSFLPSPAPPRAAHPASAAREAPSGPPAAVERRPTAGAASRSGAITPSSVGQRHVEVSAQPTPAASPAPAGQRFSDVLPVPRAPASPASPAASFAPARRAGSPAEALHLVSVEASACVRCRLHQTRTKVVFGDGAPDAQLVFVGEAPGHNEDISGKPFVGDAGKLLDKIIVGMGLTREQVYICNIIKCRPPNNRQPLPDEIEQCAPYLIEQLGIVAPKVICALGTSAAHTLLRTTEPIGRIRGKFFRYNNIELMPTYHPAYLLRNQDAKRLVWEDMQKVQLALGIPPGNYAGRGPYRV